MSARELALTTHALHVAETEHVSLLKDKRKITLWQCRNTIRSIVLMHDRLSRAQCLLVDFF